MAANNDRVDAYINGHNIEPFGLSMLVFYIGLLLHLRYLLLTHLLLLLIGVFQSFFLTIAIFSETQ